MPAHGDRLAERLDVELSRGAEVEIVERVVDFGDLAGPQHRAERTAFAEALAGTADKSSRAYKAQRRNVEWWVKGRKPMRVSVERIVSARRAQSRRVRALRAHGAEVRMRVAWYAERKPETLPPRRWVHIPREAMRDVIRQWAAGEHQAAAERLRAEFLDQYGVPNPRDWARDVQVRELTLEPGGGGALA